MKYKEHQNEIYVTTTDVECGGYKSDSDHPKIYLKINPKLGLMPFVTCLYCNKKFILKSNH